MISVYFFNSLNRKQGATLELRVTPIKWEICNATFFSEKCSLALKVFTFSKPRRHPLSMDEKLKGSSLQLDVKAFQHKAISNYSYAKSFPPNNLTILSAKNVNFKPIPQSSVLLASLGPELKREKFDNTSWNGSFFILDFSKEETLAFFFP